MPAATDIRISRPADEEEDVDIAGAVALLEAAGQTTGAGASGHDADAAVDPDTDAEAELPEGDAEETGEPEADPEDGTEEVVEAAAEDGAADDEAPEFWSPDDKAAWQKVPEALRPVLRKYEQQRIAYVNEKLREAAKAREEAGRAAREATTVIEQAATWWHQHGPTLQKAVADKWAQVDWNRLAQENPSEWTRLRQQRDHEAALVQEADRRGQADIERTRERAHLALQEARAAEHRKLEAKLPQYFGPESAAATYQALGRFLHAKGIPPERINTIHEAPIVELVLAAMRFEEAQKQASTATRAAASSTVRTTPTRVAPGPASRAGNRAADSIRQVGERFRQGGGASIADAAELIRLSGL